VRAVCLAVLVLVAASADGRGFGVRFTPFEVLPNQDRLVCEYVELPNTTAMDVSQFVVRSRPRIHHVTLTAYLGQDRDPRHLTNGRLREGVACIVIGPPDKPGRTASLLGAVRLGAYDLPEGYAVTLLPRQPTAVIMHTFNHGRRTRKTSVRLKVVPADPKRVRHHLEPIDVLNVDFELPPQRETVHEADFVAPFDMNVAMLSSHQHRFGTRVAVYPMVDGVEQPLVYENYRWREPKLAWQDPPLRLRAGDRLRVRCEWHNRSDETLRFGGSANDEMCNLTGYFFRDVELPPDDRIGIGGFLIPVSE
jgi:hypothetical protein